MQQYSTGFIFSIAILFLAACSPLNEFYVNNFSDQPIQISLNLRHSYSDLKICFFDKQIPAPSSGDAKKCVAQQTMPTSLENGMVSFALPAHTSAFLGTSSMGDLLFKKMIVTSDHQSIEITDQNYQTHFKVRDSFYGNIANTFDFGASN